MGSCLGPGIVEFGAGPGGVGRGREGGLYSLLSSPRIVDQPAKLIHPATSDLPVSS